jgi:hypothetical protein
MRLPLLALVLVLAGCGAGAKVAETPTPTPTPTPTETTTSGVPPKSEAAAVAQRYIQALVKQDFEAVCETRTEQEQRDIGETLGGTCAEGMKTIFGDGVAKDSLGDAHTGEVRVKGKVAGIDLIPKGATKPRTTIAAVVENGEWKLKDIPDEDIP